MSRAIKDGKKKGVVERHEVDDNHRMKETLGLITEVVERLMAR